MRWVALVAILVPASLRAAAPEPVERRSAIVRAVERVSPAVVSVRTTVYVQRQEPFAWFFRDFRDSRSRREEAQAQGSGVVIDDNGYVLTNFHVVQGADRILLDAVDGRSFAAEVVGTAPDHDLAVLRLRSSETLPHVPIGTSRDLMIGETVIAIGNPFGLSHTVTTGVVSALHRSIHAQERDYTDFIQTDASINPGNSGGPLLNINGELIGVNTAIYGNAQGIGFAIPIDKAKRIVDDLIAHGEVRRPYFGFDAQSLTPELAASFGLRESTGAVVSQVAKDSPADGHVREGDVVTSVDGSRVADADALRVVLGDATVGSTVTVKFLRDQKPLETQLQARELSSAQAMSRLKDRTGLEVEQVAINGGTIAVKRVVTGSVAARIGLERGDIIRAVDSQQIATLDAFGKAISRSYWRGEVTLMISRGRIWHQLAFKL